MLCMLCRGLYYVYAIVDDFGLPLQACIVETQGDETLEAGNDVHRTDDIQQREKVDGTTVVVDIGQSETAVDSETSEGRFDAPLRGDELVFMLPASRVAQQRSSPSSLFSFPDEAILLIIPARHAAQDSCRELIGIGAHFQRYAGRARSDAGVDNYLDPAALKYLFEYDNSYDAQCTGGTVLDEPRAISMDARIDL